MGIVMGIVIEMIAAGALFSLLAVANCAAAQERLPPGEYDTCCVGDLRSDGPRRRPIAEGPDISSILAELQGTATDSEVYFRGFKILYEQGQISRLDFAKGVAWVFRDDQATKERGLVDVLCEKCGIPAEDNARIELAIHLFLDPFFGDVPILVADIPQSSIDVICASGDPCRQPHPNFCRAVMNANDVKEMAEVFDTFGEKFEMDPETIAAQSKIYKTAAIGRADIPRSVLKLMIGDREISISQEDFQDPAKDIENAQSLFLIVLNFLQKPEEDGGAGLDKANAFYVLKQVALAYRGQNGVTDGYNIISTHLMGVSNSCLLLKFDGVEISMKFEYLGNRFVLVEKTECSPILGLMSVLHCQIVTSELRFKFPGDSEIRTQLPISSWQIFPVDEMDKMNEMNELDGEIELDEIPEWDETIIWCCPFRENPPRRVIFYGGCRPADTH
jgi:hypothetical protein